MDENIPIMSASVASLEFLTSKFGEKTAEEIMATTGNNKENRWMWKYTTFTAIISKYKRLSKKQCNHVISIGDGFCEYQAVKHYSERHNANVQHIRMMTVPTVTQLNKQWILLNDYFSEEAQKISSKKNQIEENENHAFDLIDLPLSFKNEKNNKKGTGSSQLKETAQYFQQWIS